MPKIGKEFSSKFFSRNPIFNYLEDKDRYLFSTEEPNYRFNVIGTGLMGMEHMRTTMLEGRGIIHGIYDTNPLSIIVAKHMFFTLFPESNLIEYDSLETACNDPEVDGIFICTPNYTHLDIVKKAMQSGKHIFLEKPMATTIQDAYEITQLVQNYNAVFQIGLQYRFKAIYREAIHEALHRNSLGNIKMINILEHRVPFLDKVSQWNKFSKYSGGTLVEKCCHYFDLLNLFAKSTPVSVYATGNMAVNFTDFKYENQESDIIDNACVTVVYKNGIRASFNLCMFAPLFHEEIIICGDEGWLKALENDNFLQTARPKTQLEIMRGEKEPARITTPLYPKHIEETGHNGATFYEHVYFIDNIEGKKTTTATTEEGFWSIVVGVAAEESIKSGEIIYIDHLLTSKNIHNIFKINDN